MQFTQCEIERELSDTVPHGVRLAVARRTGIYESIIYGYFNADDERKSPAFSLLLIQAALDEIDPAVGEAHWQKIATLRSASLPARFVPLCLATEHAKGVKEDADVSIAVIKGEPLYTQLNEVLESITQKLRQKEALIEAINIEKQISGKRFRLPDDIAEKARKRAR